MSVSTSTPMTLVGSGSPAQTVGQQDDAQSGMSRLTGASRRSGGRRPDTTAILTLANRISELDGEIAELREQADGHISTIARQALQVRSVEAELTRVQADAGRALAVAKRRESVAGIRAERAEQQSMAFAERVTILTDTTTAQVEMLRGQTAAAQSQAGCAEDRATVANHRSTRFIWGFGLLTGTVAVTSAATAFYFLKAGSPQAVAQTVASGSPGFFSSFFSKKS